MSIEHPPAQSEIKPTPQEDFLIQLSQNAYEDVVVQLAKGLRLGHSPSILSIARPDILSGFAEAWRTSDIKGTEEVPDSYKTHHFNRLVESATSGEASAIEALPKFVTSLGQMGLVAELILDNKEALESWHYERAYIQYLGTFDPQHVGHRVAVESALKTENHQASAILHVMGTHPRKKTFSASYGDRFKQSEQRFYESDLLDNRLITQVDVPGGIGLAQTYPKQMKLLSTFSGDTEYRWLTGSDKLLLDANSIRDGLPVSKAVSRFSDPRLHAYIVHRQSDDKETLENALDYVTDQFGTKITLVEELPYDCAPASSSLVKQLRQEGRHDEANHMELYELEK